MRAAVPCMFLSRVAYTRYPVRAVSFSSLPSFWFFRCYRVRVRARAQELSSSRQLHRLASSSCHLISPRLEFVPPRSPRLEFVPSPSRHGKLTQSGGVPISSLSLSHTHTHTLPKYRLRLTRRFCFVRSYCRPAGTI
jgi:hypothetical protein